MTLPPGEDPASYLLDQFDAIIRFEEAVSAKSKLYGPMAAKTWYYRGHMDCFRGHEDLLDLCKELEKIVPLDHPYWSNVSMGRV